MTEVLIVAKTRMSGNHCCIGGLDLSTNEGVRLLNIGGNNHRLPCRYEVGQVWDVDFHFRRHDQVQPPHIEDVIVREHDHLGNVRDITKFLHERIDPWVGEIDELFNGHIQFTRRGSGFINESGGIPNQSTGFWIPEERLELHEVDQKLYYYVESPHVNRRLSYVGFDEPINEIPPDSLLRVSLARWWKPDDAEDMELRCYLQLSGWY